MTEYQYQVTYNDDCKSPWCTTLEDACSTEGSHREDARFSVERREKPSASTYEWSERNKELAQAAASAIMSLNWGRASRVAKATNDPDAETLDPTNLNRLFSALCRLSNVEATY